MSILRRKLFNRGGYAHRGTGITSGLTPVQRFQGGGQATIRPEMLPTWMTFFGNLGTPSYKTGFGAAFEDIRGAAKATAPVLAEAMAAGRKSGSYLWAWNTVDKRYDRVTDEIIAASPPGMYVKEAPSEGDSPNSWQEYVLTVPEGEEPTAEGFTQFLKGETTASIPTSWSEYVLQVPEGTEPTPTGYGQFLDRNKYKVPNEFITYLLTVPKDQEPTPTGFKEFLDRNTGKDTDETWDKEKIQLQLKTDSNSPMIDAFRHHDKESDKIEIRDQRGELITNLDDYNIFEIADDKTETAKGLKEGWYVNKDGKKVDAEFTQIGKDYFWINDAGVSIPLEQAIRENEWKDYDIESGVPKYVKSIEDIKTELEETQNIEAAYDLMKPVLQSYVDGAQGNRDKINKTNELMTFLKDSTAGSYAEQRNAFLRLLDTFGFETMAPDTYAEIKELLKGGSIPGTELVNAMFKASVLQDALDWSQQLNRSELGLLFEKGPQIYLTKPGQELLAMGSKADAEIKLEAARMIREGLAEQKNLRVIYKDVEDYMDEAYNEFLNRDDIKAAIKKVQDYDTLGDLSHFTDMSLITASPLIQKQHI